MKKLSLNTIINNNLMIDVNQIFYYNLCIPKSVKINSNLNIFNNDCIESNSILNNSNNLKSFLSNSYLLKI